MSKKLMLKVVDGCPAMQVIMVKEPVTETGCDGDRHCACHGGNPFFCCKCGAEFKFDEEDGGS